MRLFGIDRLADDLAADTAARIRAEYDGITVGDSPIEKLFYIAVEHLLERSHVGRALYRSAVPPATFTHADDELEVIISTQEVLLHGWRVDFVYRVRANRGAWPLIVVECDGHDFHERTKEQAARDRSRDRELQSLGHKVLRFTGSEIYRNPLKCAQELIRQIDATRFEVDA